ncbi:M20/M25/M40 family metallo-hydrolase [Schumannella luteola]
MAVDLALERFQELVRIPTVSRLETDEVEWEHFDRFREALERLYPALHRTLEREIVGGHTMLYRWKGRYSTEPAVLMAHYDVVAATDEGWSHAPFAASVTGSGDTREIWGRGTIDDKGSLVAILEAVESQVESGFQPAHDVYLVFGHDEETHGSGAAAAAAVLEERGIRPSLVLDEGGAVADDAFPGVSEPLAVIGVAEKGPTLVRLVVDQKGGHASTPPRLSATARLARAIVRLNSTPFPAGFNPAVLEMLRTLAPHATGTVGRALRSLAVTKPLLLRVFSKSDETRAMTQTTQAVTQLAAGHAANALPERAEAMVNIRVAVGSSVAEAVKHVRKAIRDDAVAVEIVQGTEPSPISPTSGQAWDTIAATVATSHPEAIVTPYVQTGATDSRSFTGISRGVYRFTPFVLSRAERDALHAKNERMRVASWERGVGFYRDLLARL